MAGKGRAHQLGNSWTGQVAAAGDAAPAILGAYWGCRFYVLGGCRLPSTFVYDPLLQRADTDLLAALHYDYTLPRASSGTLPGTTANYGILENDPGAQGRSTTAHPFEDVALGNPEAGGICDAADRRGARALSKASVVNG